MTKLYIDGNEIGPGGGIAFGECLKRMPNLKKLCIENNRIGDEGATAIS
jgi:hypothetical protein